MSLKAEQGVYLEYGDCSVASEKGKVAINVESSYCVPGLPQKPMWVVLLIPLLGNLQARLATWPLHTGNRAHQPHMWDMALLPVVAQGAVRIIQVLCPESS